MGNQESRLDRGGCVIVVEGNIGAGKSTLCHKLQNMLGGPDRVRVLTEEILKDPLLAKFYAEPEKYAYDLHKRAVQLNYLAMAAARVLANDGYIVVLDRCLVGVWVFINANLGKMTPEQSAMITAEFKEAFEDSSKPDLYIHLTTCVDRCMENIKERGRPMEMGIEREYLRQLDQYHDEIIGGLNPVKVLKMPFNIVTNEDLARIRACQPLLTKPENQYTNRDCQDTDPLESGWAFS